MTHFRRTDALSRAISLLVAEPTWKFIVVLARNNQEEFYYVLENN